jgi:hypothetical protein
MFNFKTIQCVLCLLCSSAIYGQSVESRIFPWLGHWQGDLVWQMSADSSQVVPMHLRIQPLDSANCYTWNLVYGEDQKDNRGYVLRPIDASKGHWQVDEGNGIVIDHYLFGTSFISSFDVMGSTVVDEFELDGDMMHVRFYSFATEPATRSGLGTEESPTVQSFRAQSVQKVKLKRMAP